MIHANQKVEQQQQQNIVDKQPKPKLTNKNGSQI